MPKIDLSLKQISDLLDKKLKPVSTRLDRIEEKLKFQGFSLEAHTESLVNIENDVRILPDLMARTVEYSEKLGDHEERIEHLESPTKF